jgi:5'(3')-deoxyribonucleotidase
LERKINWIKQYFPFIGDSYIISMKHKWLFRCDVMIEDRLDTLLKGHHYDRICIDFPWNREVRDEAYGIYRCKDWNDVLAAVNRIGGV